ncbi:3-oxoacyl-ACP reductase FabG [Pseudoflavonifractor capillosus]|uniref:elongation factor P 5-aminopentanone reductase n=1 Tax=Pseudoflavonifractor capillosus TaxID=106588 RepID=UPI00195BD384|nr:3-oxoacyl-ACP reductase FabG [Pseudoflavonifractor capillosus]MBM6695280.1 3-oxoacyl-ACP reductase FabG [Pseudoflavonifractor capillosus]
MKYALITGASGGIGAATARAFAQAGYGVAIHAHRSVDKLHALAQELSALSVPVLEVCADLSDPVQAKTMVDNVLEKFCQLDILVCCSGLSHVGLVTDIDPQQWRTLFGVNVDGMHYCCQAVLPHMVHRKEGCILTVSSMWGQVGASCEVAYSATKGAVIAYTKALAQEVGPSNIRVNCIAPGVIATEMNAHLSPEDMAALADETPLGRIGTPEECAACALFLASEGASFVTGQVLAPNGGLVI